VSVTLLVFLTFVSANESFIILMSEILFILSSTCRQLHGGCFLFLSSPLVSVLGVGQKEK
jgi:hypothetical protein